jgi:hypothetical protein
MQDCSAHGAISQNIIVSYIPIFVGIGIEIGNRFVKSGCDPDSNERAPISLRQDCYGFFLAKEKVIS